VGVQKDTFNLTDNVYVNGSGYAPSTTYNIYLVSDVAMWSDGMVIPSRVTGTVTTITSNNAGRILPATVWNSPLTLGKYDIIVDVNGNGKYDAGIDALDNNDVQVTAGFVVIPEYTIGTILALAGYVVALSVFQRARRQTR
ncbi:MAG TPA: hypothetical protein VMT26_01005, partial [Candidatus Bathyarchaeia archaeon]|nr:hypothetical protein [Candidatus Bathyarchaeia archaeon]